MRDPERFVGMRAAAARREHGARARYVAGCRCMLCRAANSRYQVGRNKARREGDVRDLVGAGAAVAHIKRLGRRGIGYKAVAAAAGVALSVVQGIRAGTQTRIRASTERAILAVDTDAHAAGALVDAAPAWRLIGRLVADGYTKVWLARQLGQHGAGLQLGKTRMTARSASRVERLYRMIQAGRISR